MRIGPKENDLIYFQSRRMNELFKSGGVWLLIRRWRSPMRANVPLLLPCGGLFVSELPGCNECNPQGYPEMIKPFIPCPHCSMTKPNEPSMGDEAEAGRILDEWNDVTGFVAKGTSYFWEIQSLIEDGIKRGRVKERERIMRVISKALPAKTELNKAYLAALLLKDSMSEGASTLTDAANPEGER